MKKIKNIPNSGDIRIIEKFLLFPKSLRVVGENATYFETRWLEKAKWSQEYRFTRPGFHAWIDDTWED